MKVALLGNMNNNHFALMRYLRDLGVDAHLLRYFNDANGTNAHFFPESDTWDIKKWESFIIQSELPIGGLSALKYLITRRKYIRNLFKSYDIIIGNGFAPGYLSFTKKNLDIFLPYHIGGEFLRFSWLSSISDFVVQAILIFFQIIGLKRCKIIGTADLSKENLKYFKLFGLKTTPLEIPMVYNQEKVDLKRLNLSNELLTAINLMKNFELVVFSHVSHIWKNLPNSYPAIKKNDVLLKGFANYYHTTKNKNAQLFLVDYGHDVICSKQLIKELGIEEQVQWLPKLSRKEILLLLDYVDIGAGEFGGYFWGGTGWEFLSKGVPFLQNVENLESIMKNVNKPVPEILNVKTPEEIAQHLINFQKNPDFYKTLGIKLKEWFDEFNGINLTKQYVTIIQNIQKK